MQVSPEPRIYGAILGNKGVMKILMDIYSNQYVDVCTRISVSLIFIYLTSYTNSECKILMENDVISHSI